MCRTRFDIGPLPSSSSLKNHPLSSDDDDSGSIYIYIYINPLSGTVVDEKAESHDVGERERECCIHTVEMRDGKSVRAISEEEERARLHACDCIMACLYTAPKLASVCVCSRLFLSIHTRRGKQFEK